MEDERRLSEVVFAPRGWVGSGSAAAMSISSPYPKSCRVANFWRDVRVAARQADSWSRFSIGTEDEKTCGPDGTEEGHFVGKFLDHNKPH